jgi:signal transduction histidine kinase
MAFKSNEIIKKITNILSILKADQEDKISFKQILGEIIELFPGVEKASFWELKKNCEYYICGIGYDDEAYEKNAIPLEYSLSTQNPLEDVIVMDSGFYMEGFPEMTKMVFEKAGIQEDVSTTLQLRLKPFGDYFGVFCFDCLNDKEYFTDEMIEGVRPIVAAINSFLELRIQLKNSERDNMYRDHLVASISHDVRTPLTVVMGYTELLQSMMEDDVEVMKFLKVMEEQSNYLLNIISDLITLSKINSGNFSISPQKTNIREMVHNTVKGLNILAKKKNLTLNYKISSNVPLFTFIDRTSLQKILMNVVSNAIKYTEKGSVKLECTLENEEFLKFTVTDTGVGIDKDRLEKIFERYTREEHTASKPGSGLGLSICKELIEELSGSIWAESELGKGSVFNVLLPLSKADSIAETAEVKTDINVFLKGKNILILEDDIENLHMFELILKNAGANCFTYQDPQDAVNKCHKKTNIDYILVDLLLSKGSSIETIRKFKSFEFVKKLIAITGSADSELHSEAVENGADIVLLKPFSLRELVESLDG